MTNIDISIIIPTRNRESILWETVHKAVEAIKGKNAEILVVNDGDRKIYNNELIAKNITIIDNNKKGVSAARNKGSLSSKGSILFFIDDDMWINPEIIDWINLHLIKNDETEAVYNVNWEYPQALKLQLEQNKMGRYILSSDYHTMWGRMNVNGKKPVNGLYKFNAIASCSLLLSKNLFNKIGGYNESITFQGEDIELSNRVAQLGIPVYCLFDTTLHHNHADRLDLDGFLERAARGYESQFIAEKAGYISPSQNDYAGSRIFIYNAFLASEKIWNSLYKIIPNNGVFGPVINRLIGLLSGAEKYKQWKKAFAKPS